MCSTCEVEFTLNIMLFYPSYSLITNFNWEHVGGQLFKGNKCIAERGSLVPLHFGKADWSGKAN